MLPLRRQHKLLIEQLADETLVYDQARHKAHCLNRTASLVWQHCDGHTTISQLAARVGQELGTKVSTDVIATAIADLEKARLLENSPGRQVTRRQAAGKMAAAGLAAVVATVSAPTAAQAQSLGQCCTSVSQCRAGFNCVARPQCNRCPSNKCCG